MGLSEYYAWRTSTFGQGTHDHHYIMPDFYSNLLSLERQLRNLRLQHQQTLKCRRTYLAHHVTGHVKWYNVKQGYGFITRDDTSADVFVHKSSITMNNVDKLHPSVGDGEAVEFDVVLVPGRTPEAVNVTGPNGTRVQGSMHSPDRQYRRVMICLGQGGLRSLSASSCNVSLHVKELR